MSAARDSSQRLQRLEQILVQSKTSAVTMGGNDADPAHVLLDRAPIERVRQVTSELQHRGAGDDDDVDAVTARLLLNDYAAAVTHLRAVVLFAEQRFEAATHLIEEARRLARRQQKLERKRAPAERAREV